MGRLRVLIVEPSDRSGDWHYANMLASALMDEGVEVRLATLSPFDMVFTPRAVPVVSIGPYPPVISWPRTLFARRAVYHLAKVLTCLRVILEYRPNIVHFQQGLGVLDFGYFRAIRRSGSRLAYTVHAPLPPRLGSVGRARFRQVDLILVHSLRTQSQLEAEGIPGRKIRRILHGNYLHLCRPTDLPAEEARRLLGIPEDAEVILFFGSIAWRKGLDRLIDAFGMLKQSDMRLYMVISGYPNEDFGPYERRMEKLGIRDRVVLNLNWTPYSEMQKYFNASSVVVLPYRRVSQSGVIQLAYAYARPVVVTDVGGIGEMVAEDGTGIVVKSDSPEAIAEAIRVLLADPACAAHMGQLGRRLAETKYDWRRIAQRVSELYRNASAEIEDRPA